MSETLAPTCEELSEYDGEEIVAVKRDADDSWRHGAYITHVFRRLSDNTYWQATYCLSTDQETNELRDGDATITRVYPKQVTVTEYVAEAP